MARSELVTKCNRLKLQSSDGKNYLQDVLNTKGILRLIQSIPSKKAEQVTPLNASTKNLLEVKMQNKKN